MRYSIQDALNDALGILKTRDRPRLEAEILLSFVLGVDRVFLHTHSTRMLDEQQWMEFEALILRLQNHEPIEYLIKKVGFYGYEWEICKGVLIPRPETELLVEYVTKMIQAYDIKYVFEFGVGSGVISIMLALLHPHLLILASDINPLAIELTRKNIDRFLSLDETLRDRIDLIQSNVLQEKPDLKGFDLLISNPPYIALSYPLPLNVQYEPKEALFGGENGEEILCALIDLAKQQSFSWIACEMGFDQKSKIFNKLRDCKNLEFYRDLSGLDRGFIAKL